MLFGEMIAVALQSVRANMFRAILAMLGIIIGVASVIAMMAIGSGARQAVDEQIESLGASVLTIRSGNAMMRGIAQGEKSTLKLRDSDALAADAGTLTSVVPELTTMAQAKVGDRNQSLRVVGSTPNFAEVGGYKLQTGRLLAASDGAAKRTVALLGGGVPAKFEMAASDLLGQTIYLKGIAFTVVGVLEEKGQQGFRNPDEQIWIPIDTARYRVVGADSLDSIAARMVKGLPVEQGIADIERVLRREHKILPGEDNDFSIADPRQFMEIRETTAKIFSFLISGIASIILVVGGIGIMNIMLVTVTERTREIGIRKALGATRRNILTQFLIESLVMCLIGGALGVLAGTGIGQLIGRIAHWNTHMSPLAIALAFGFSAAIGLVFGLLPARKAAALDPIEALRYE
jgi:putative ABC transport system permease protein